LQNVFLKAQLCGFYWAFGFLLVVWVFGVSGLNQMVGYGTCMGLTVDFICIFQMLSLLNRLMMMTMLMMLSWMMLSCGVAPEAEADGVCIV